MWRFVIPYQFDLSHGRGTTLQRLDKQPEFDLGQGISLDFRGSYKPHQYDLGRGKGVRVCQTLFRSSWSKVLVRIGTSFPNFPLPLPLPP